MAVGDPERTFSHIYATGAWVRGSGPGSDLRASASYRRFISDFVAENDIRSVLDFGCGDWRVSGAIQWGSARYLGVDVVPSLVEWLRKTRARPGVEFDLAPASMEDLPTADLLIAKDVLQHWPSSMVHAFLRVLPRYKYALITNDFAPAVPLAERVNPDIALGEWRDLDLRAPPFDADATAVHLCRGPVVRDPRNWRGWGKPAWTKMILLMRS